ncbi:hypothetical protein BGZ65_001853 [Modicella reniformis]|uniref:Uncharacterized protein n=1 Tax=Modicella reniformis TaxID=1440133 RepID=A0A9P6LTZ2_9FUNG|nr:hypothetical protein BGZ65_001853 [Modicella reniformis]
MAINQDNEPMQAFRSRLADEIVDIPVRMDPRTGNYIVLWSDIQDGFENAKSVRKGTSLVPFITNDNFEQIIPLRIAYHPGIVLEVVVGGSTQAEPTAIGRETGDHIHILSSPFPADFNSMTQDMTTLTTTDYNANSQLPVKYSDGMPEESQSAVHSFNQLYHSYFQAVMTGQEIQAANIIQSVNQHFDGLQAEMEKNKTLQEQLVQMQQEMLQMQKQTLERLAIIQGRVQALLTQTYELHEYPIPRLFIVLPKEKGLIDKMKNPITDQYRLYFLCECGMHTMAEHSKTPPLIHLAKHEGYDVDRPTEFFERYGSYILTLMNMIKFGIIAASVIVPSLASLKILDGLDTTKEHINYIRSNITPLVDNTIKALQDLKSINTTGTELTMDAEFDKLEALEGADLRQLESYLTVKDQGRVGNLYRIVTPEGHVKWHLREVVELNRGNYIEETGRIEIKIESSNLARQFYDEMVKARGIQELDITLYWDATMDDLRSLAKAVAKANVISLTIDGTHFKNPSFDVINRGRRFDPILQLASNTGVRSLQLKGFDDFFHRTSKPSMTLAQKFRVFSMKLEVFDEKTFQSFQNLLEDGPLLTTLDLNLDHQYSVVEAISSILGRLQKLESLKIESRGRSIAASVSQGKMKVTGLIIRRLVDFDFDQYKFIRKDHLCNLTRLAIKYTPDEDPLADVLLHCPRLSHVQIGCKSERVLAIINRVISTRERILQEERSSCLRTLEMMIVGLKSFDVLADCDDYTYIQSILSFAEDSNAFGMRTWIRLQNKMSSMDNDPVNDFIRQHGWSIVFFDENKTKNDTFAAILDDIPSTRAAQLESLRFNTINFTASGFIRLDKIIQRSPNFKGLGLNVHLSEQGSLEMAQSLLSQYGTQLFSLELYGYVEKWLPEIASSFPTRDSFPNMASLKLKSNPPSRCIPWIVAMISSPSQILVSSSSDRSLAKNVVDKRSTRSDSEVTGSWTKLRRFRLRFAKLQPEEWRQLIQAIDFSVLEDLGFYESNFSREQLKLLIDCIPNNIHEVPLKTLDLLYTRLRYDDLLFAELQRKALLVTIEKYVLRDIGNKILAFS